MTRAALRGFAHQLADTASAISLKAFRSRLQVTNKLQRGFDPVTRADKSAERAMRGLIKKKFPTHGIWGEEYGWREKEQGNEYLWVLDPIDGTRSFIIGNPLWGTLIALLRYDGATYTPILNLVDYPALGERVLAEAGGATWRIKTQRRERLRTRACRSLARARLASTSPAMFTTPKAAARWGKIARAAELTRYGGDCYNYALLAGGYLDAVIERGNSTHDTQALLLLVEQAGGVITDWQGNSLAGPRTTEKARGETLACGDVRLHAELVRRLR